MEWQEEYKKRFVTPQEAVQVVKSGDVVGIPLSGECVDLSLALAARREELKGVEVYIYAGGMDVPWYEAGWEEAFTIKSMYLARYTRAMMNEGRGHYIPALTAQWPAFRDDLRPEKRWKDVDVVMTIVSPPNKQGFCSFGASMWNKKTLVKEAKKVLCGVEERYIRTFGDNFVHVSEIDCFVKNTPPPPMPPPWSLDETPVTKGIAQYVSTLIQDGDTLQIGGGSTTYPLVNLGILDGKHDLGWHSELTVPGVIDKIREGVITGKHKTLNTGKAVGTTLGNTEEDRAFVNENPMCEVYGVDYVNDIKTIAAHDKMVAINNILQIDLTGQVNSESFGPRQYSGPGGQFEFAVGTALSRGGRSMMVLPSTALNGKVSNILSVLPEGTIVTTPRNLTDYVVTEYGIARLAGKSHKERALELIAITHPDFRAELKKEAERLYWGKG